MTGVEYKEEYDREYIDELVKGLVKLGAKTVVLTGVSYKKGMTGVVVSDGINYDYYEHEKLSNSCHGTGDIYASAFVGALINGKDALLSAKISADYTVECIKETAKVENHWYGACFEPVLIKLIKAINE
jgi:pyridoxine kinase